jgi:sugar O-acyltransferase (sialic acid O-acetyltransferase NeuD family)
MKKPIIIWGDKDLAEMAHFYLTQTGRKVVGFTKHNTTEAMFKGLPIRNFKDLQKKCPPEEYDMFVPINRPLIRKKIVTEVQSAGYKFINFIHDSAHIWHPSAIIGTNNFIQELNNIQYGTYIGSHNVLWAGNHIGHHSEIGDYCHFTSHVTLSGHCKVDSFSWFGVNSTVRDFLSISEGSLIGAHSYVNKSIKEKYKCWIGTPAVDYGDSKVNL